METITFLRHDFEVGDAVCIDGRTAIVTARTPTTITVRPIRWYELAWRWLVSQARRLLR